MEFDGITLASVVAELKQKVLGAVIRQIYQPERDLITMELWSGEEQTLLISAGAEPRIHLTEESFINPDNPPAFCMLLRKYLKGGIIQDIRQPGLERLVDLHIKRDNEYMLRGELLGRNSNLILIANGIILGAIKQGIGTRTLIPRANYQPPPAQEKINPLQAGRETFIALLKTAQAEELWQALLKNLEGIGPKLAKEISTRASIDPAKSTTSLEQEELEALWESVSSVFTRVANDGWGPVVYYKAGKVVDCAPFPLCLYEDLEQKEMGGISSALDECYHWKRCEGEFEELFASLSKVLHHKIAKIEEAQRKVAIDLEKAKSYNKYREEGDLIMANLSLLKKGEREAELEDFLGSKRKISLDPSLSPVENAQRRYARYKKLKRGVEKLTARKAELEMELAYLQQVENSLLQAEGKEELLEIAAELEAVGYIKKDGRKSVEKPARPREYSLDGYKVLVGKSGRQNDELIRTASREDFWLHAKDRPGAHVIIKTNNQPERVPEEVLFKAAQLAAYYSKGRDSTKVPVSFTLVKYLRKPKGAKPGLVICMKEEGTLLVPPKPLEVYENVQP